MGGGGGGEQKHMDEFHVRTFLLQRGTASGVRGVWKCEYCLRCSCFDA